MKYLLRKEIVLFFSSAIGYVIIFAWLLITSLMLWVFGGDYNIPDGGYATLRSFFSLTPALLVVFIPAITMRLFAEERRSGTLELLLFRPVSLWKIVLAKYISACFLLILTLLPTLVYVFSLEMMSSAGLDVGELVGGYVGLFLLGMAFCAIGILSSTLTSNQLVAFLLAVLLSLSSFYGFELLSSLYSDGNLHNLITDLGMNAHYRSMMRGVIDSRDLIYFISLIVLFLYLSILLLSRKRKQSLFVKGLVALLFLIGINLISATVFIRADLTDGKRYTLSGQSRELVSSLNKPLEVLLYLDGGLNPAFDRLRTAAIDLLEELSQYSTEGILLKKINPAIAPDEVSRQQNFLEMDERGMKGIAVNERDREGKISSKVVFPWVELVYNGDTIPVGLLKKNISLSPQEILNVSVGDLEYSLTEAIRLLTMKEPARIAFIEGHGEWEEPYVYEATEQLSKYYNVDRGMISGNPEELFPYKALIIASPKTPFTEVEKFALDQYLMQGGSLFFLLDGVKISTDEFDRTGESATLKPDLNLDDLLFTYGVRVNPVTVQDMNCTPIRVASSQAGSKEAYVTVPWYFSPLLEPASNHAITRNLSPLKSELVSTITWVGSNELKKTVLLTTSPNAHLLPVPEKVSLRYIEMPADPAYFNEAHLPVAGLLEGSFPSAFRNRISPEGISPGQGFPKVDQSKPARLLVAASGSLIKNDWKGQGHQSMPLPLGYDAVTGEQLGNADFIANAVNYLAGNEQWLTLRSRNFQLRLLSKQAVTTDLLKWQLVNVLVPLLIPFFFGGIFSFRRKQKYSKLSPKD